MRHVWCILFAMSIGPSTHAQTTAPSPAQKYDPFADIAAGTYVPPPAPAPEKSGWFDWLQTKGQRAEKANARGEACLKRRDYRTAVAAFSEAVAAQPGVARYHFKLGVALGNAGVLDQAADEFRTTLKLDPAFPDARKNLAKATSRIEHDRAEAAAAALAARFDR